MKNKNNSWKYFLGLAVALGLPLSFYLIAKGLGKDKMHMPLFYIADQVDSQLVNGKMDYDTVWHQAAELEAVNQFGDKIALNRDLKGRILVIDFFFTTCPSICPQLTRSMKQLQDVYKPTPMKKNDDLVQFISITVNPERDSFKVLHDYALKYGADMNRWWFLTGDKAKLYNYARHELHLSTPDGNGGADDFIHSQQIVVVDVDRNIRGYYDGLVDSAVHKCAYDIGQLILEKKHKKKF